MKLKWIISRPSQMITLRTHSNKNKHGLCFMTLIKMKPFRSNIMTPAVLLQMWNQLIPTKLHVQTLQNAMKSPISMWHYPINQVSQPDKHLRIVLSILCFGE